MNLKRSDRQYVEVEAFEDYELTQCIVYEMAARDWHYKDMADGVVNYYNHYKKVIDYYLNIRPTLPLEVESIANVTGRNCEIAANYYLNDKNTNTKEVNEKKFIQGMEEYFELTSLIGEIELIELEDIPHGYNDPRLGNEFWEIYKKCMYGYSISNGKKTPE